MSGLKPIIELKNIHKRYLNFKNPKNPNNSKNPQDVKSTLGGVGAWAVKDISLEIYPGEVFGIIGRSGAGKSSLLRLLNFLEQPTSGVVKIHGQDLSGLSTSALRKVRQKMGMIFQHFNLLTHRTVLENTLLALEIACENKKSEQEKKARALELLALVKLSHKIHSFPSELSGGEKQRVAIARALANQPEILLCDEATSALDPETTQSILELLKEINKTLGVTLVLITHEMNVIKKIADRVGVLDQGEWVEVGPVVSVFTRPNAEITKELIRSSLHLDLPENIKKVLFKSPAAGCVPLIKLVFVGDQVNQPILSALSDVFGNQVKVNILQASLEWIQETPMGITVCELLGEKVVEALEHLRQNKIEVEVLGYVAN